MKRLGIGDPHSITNLRSKRRHLRRSSLTVVLFLVTCVAVSAQDWNPTISQFQHTAWTVKDGAPGLIHSLAQTSDGYLWLGSDDGLYRFDGVTFERYEPRAGGPIPTVVRTLWSDDGTDLWIGSFNVIVHLKDGNATSYTTKDGVPPGRIEGFSKDKEGKLWAAGKGGLARLEGNHWRKVGADWNFPGNSAQTLFLDRKGTLWVATEDTLVFLTSGARSFEPTGIHVGQVLQFAEAPNGKLWMAEISRSARPVPLGDHQLPADDTEILVGATRILFDHEGAVWVSTLGDGLRRSAHPERLTGKLGEYSHALEILTAKDGLTDNFARCLLQDREGNIWVGTHDGLNRFRRSNLVPVALPAPLREPNIVPGDNGDLWVTGLRLWTLVHAGRAEVLTGEFHDDPKGGLKLDWNAVREAYRGPTGAIWWLGAFGLHRFKDNHFRSFPLPKDVPVASTQDAHLTEDRSGVIWAAFSGAGLFRMDGDSWKRFETSPEIARLTPTAAYTDWMGRVWFGYREGTIISIDNETIQIQSSGKSPTPEEIFAINGRDRHVWIGSSRGLLFFDGSHFQPVIPIDAAGFGSVWGVEETQDGGLWFGEPRSVVHISGNEVQHFLRDPSYRVQYERFDPLDGLPGTFQARLDAQELQGTDGRLWFAAGGGLAWLDPTRILRNTLSPPVSIRSMTADGKQYAYWADPVLPAQTGSLQIQFTALSLSIPERVRFRYKLEGRDRNWQDSATRREVSYSGLGPGKYRFRVIACNNDGVWNNVGAYAEFRIAPAWYQTYWFFALCAVTAFLVVWAFYRMRLRQVAHAMSLRFDERLSERTRLARDLHDTFLQTIQGSKYVADSALKQTTEPSPIRGSMEELSVWLGQAIVEGRAAVNSLRTSTTETNHLAEAFRRSIEECRIQNPIEASFAVVGEVSEMHPIARDEVYRIGYEAIRNACAHAHATQLRVELTYADDLILRIRDNGVGIDPAIVSEGKQGHFGLQGMRERASRIMAKLAVETSPASGTEIKLVVPGSVIYRRATSNPRKLTVIKSILKRLGLTSNSNDF